eukprot:9763746-Lingulodinium_polyedra.AAC.1
MALIHGKGGEAIYACGKEFLPKIRAHGHIGIVVWHFAFDGALHTFLAKRFRQHLLGEAIQEAPGVRAAGGDPEELMLKVWVVDTQCTAHVCHNALKWS